MTSNVLTELQLTTSQSINVDVVESKLCFVLILNYFNLDFDMADNFMHSTSVAIPSFCLVGRNKCTEKCQCKQSAYSQTPDSFQFCSDYNYGISQNPNSLIIWQICVYKLGNFARVNCSYFRIFIVVIGFVIFVVVIDCHDLVVVVDNTSLHQMFNIIYLITLILIARLFEINQFHCDDLSQFDCQPKRLERSREWR